MEWRVWWVLSLITTVAAASCAPLSPAARAPTAISQPPSGEPSRTLVAAVRVEPLTIAARPLREQGVAVYLSGRMFNAAIALLDDTGVERPYLSEKIPQLNTEDWRIFPDGHMETTYRLKPNLTWHDGAALTADDFVFAWRVYATPELGLSGAQPFSSIEEVIASDPRTVMVRWRRPYPDAGGLTDRNGEFPPLPRHVLEKPFGEDTAEVFSNHPYWTTAYMGLGPYRLERWEPGAFIEASAFDGHVLGRPRIERIKLVFFSDSNTTLANMLSGEIHLSGDSSLRVAQVATLKREWGASEGKVILHPNQWRAVYFQFRPDIVHPRALLDPRVRRALAHAIDKGPINEAVYDGNSIVADFMIAPRSEAGDAVDQAIAKYAFDLRRSEELMAEAGFRKGTDGIYTDPSDVRFSAEIKTNAAQDNEAEMAILASGWRAAGFDVQDSVLPAALARNNEVRASFQSMFANNTAAGETALFNQTSAKIPREGNRWQGGNRGGWSNPEYDRLAESLAMALDRGERTRLLVEIGKLYTAQLPAISLFYRTIPWAFVSGLTGLKDAPPEGNVSWNIHEWEFR